MGARIIATAIEYAYILPQAENGLREGIYMMMNSNLILGYDYDKWYGYGVKEPLTTDISSKTNSHILISGMSGSGKSYCENILFSKLGLVHPNNEVYFADYKQDDQFAYLRGYPRYYPYKKSLEALEIVYEKLQKRQTGEDKERHPITLIWDEYMANILALQNEDKKMATVAMNKVSEILMLGRSLSVRFFSSCQRPDAIAFPSGSRLNYGIIIILGAPMRSIYEMLMPVEYINKIEDRNFKTGEGVLLLQGSVLHFIKVAMVQDINRMQEICVKALT